VGRKVNGTHGRPIVRRQPEDTFLIPRDPATIYRDAIARGSRRSEASWSRSRRGARSMADGETADPCGNILRIAREYDVPYSPSDLEGPARLARRGLPGRRVRSSDADTTWVPSGDSLRHRGRGRLCCTRVRMLSLQVPDVVTPVEALQVLLAHVGGDTLIMREGSSRDRDAFWGAL